MKDTELRRKFLDLFLTEQDIQVFCHEHDLPFTKIMSWIQRRSVLKPEAQQAIESYVKQERR